jgi:hypothetical protein
MKQSPASPFAFQPGGDGSAHLPGFAAKVDERDSVATRFRGADGKVKHKGNSGGDDGEMEKEKSSRKPRGLESARLLCPSFLLATPVWRPLTDVATLVLLLAPKLEP